MKPTSAVATIAACAVLFAGLGCSVGWCLGTCFPGYYRSVFFRGRDPDFDPVSVGVGQGLTQGLAGGIAIGLIVVGLFLWRDSRIARRSDPD